MLKKFLRMFFRMFLETRDGEEALSIMRVTFATFFWIVVRYLLKEKSIPGGAVTIFSILAGAITGAKIVQGIAPFFDRVPRPPKGDV